MRKLSYQTIGLTLGAAAVGFGAVFAVLAPSQTQQLARATLGRFGAAGCTIKGNISLNGGERIYHVPGQRFYDETRISPELGERYFCSEAEAQAAGWRKSRV